MRPWCVSVVVGHLLMLSRRRPEQHPDSAPLTGSGTTGLMSPCLRAISSVVLVVVGLSAVVDAQTPVPPPSIAAATARLQAKDPAGAEKILVALTTAEPKNGRAWRNLGVVRQQLKDYTGARAAFMQSLDVEPSLPAPLYNLGIVAALDGKTDEAFEWLAKAKASHKIDMMQMEGAAPLAALKKDPRYAALLPTPADFQHSFAEDVTVLREWHGEASGDQFGWIARNIGDVDGDGVPDVVTSAPSSKRGGEDAGRIYVYSTKSSKLLWAASGAAKDELGTGIEGAGDTNKDGIPDVIASAPGAGYAKVYSGRDGRVLLTLKAEAPAGKTDRFGTHASGAGDVNGDGYADVIVGAPMNGAGGESAGRAYVFSGKDGKVLLTLTGEHAGDELS